MTPYGVTTVLVYNSHRVHIVKASSNPRKRIFRCAEKNGEHDMARGLGTEAAESFALGASFDEETDNLHPGTESGIDPPKEATSHILAPHFFASRDLRGTLTTSSPSSHRIR